MFDDFIALVYPRNCLACGNSLYKHEEYICNYCYLNLPKSNYHTMADNPLEKLFYGRFQVFSAAGYYLFNKQSGIQKLLHDIKYKGNKELAVTIGKWYGKDLKESPRFSSVDYIVPVPLHPKKLKQRGYNQSEQFAKGLADSMQKTVNTSDLIRKSFTGTQTKKSKFERWENVEDMFELNNTSHFKNKHVLLVDDVITTGATVEACCEELYKAEGVKISLASIAFAAK